MGVYLDSKTGYALYKSETEKPYFVDKTLLLKELFPLVEEGSIMYVLPVQDVLEKRLCVLSPNL